MKFDDKILGYHSQINEEYITKGKIIFSRMSDDKKVVWATVMEEDHYTIEYNGEGKRNGSKKVKFDHTDPKDIKNKLSEVKDIVKKSMDIYNNTGKIILINKKECEKV